jgi:SAM-dependent methyltransferase
MSTETYTPGYSDVAIRYMMRRYAARDAAFVLPYLDSGVRLLDCGCGPGTITVGLAKAVGAGSVVGLDLDAAQIELATRVAQQHGAGNVRFEVGSVYQLPFPDQSFDVVYSHALCEHLAGPLEALREMHRVLRPGGVVGIATPDWGGVVVGPPDELVQAGIEAYTTLQQNNGGNPFIGRRLGELLDVAGFGGVTLSAVYDCYEDASLITDLLAERLETAATSSAGPSGKPSVKDICDSMRRWAKGPRRLFAQTFVEAVGQVL